MPPRGSDTRRIADLEARQASMHRELRSEAVAARVVPPIPIRWAITCDDPNTATYPVASTVPNTYWFKFVDGTFDQSDDGAVTPSWTNRSSNPLSVVQNLADTLDSYIPEGTKIPIWRHNGRWWTDWSIPNVHHVTTGGAAIAAGASASVTLPSGRVVTATNWSTDTTIDAGSKCLCWRDQWNATFYLVKTGGESNSRVWHATAVDDIDAGATGTVELPDTTQVEAENWTDAVDIESEEKILVWQDPTDDLYYAIKGGGTSTRWFRCTLTGPGDLAHASATVGVTTYQALDGGTHPGAVTAQNVWGLSAQYPAECLIAKNAAAATYDLVQIFHVVKTLVNDVQYDAGTHTLKYRKQDITVMHQAAAAAFVDLIVAENTGLVEDVTWDGVALKQIIRQAFTFPASQAGPTEPILTAVSIPVVHNVFVSGLNLFQNRSYYVTVFSAAGNGDQLIALGDQCDAPAGSIVSEPTVDHTAEFLPPPSES